MATPRISKDYKPKGERMEVDDAVVKKIMMAIIVAGALARQRITSGEQHTLAQIKDWVKAIDLAIDGEEKGNE